MPCKYSTEVRRQVIELARSGTQRMAAREDFWHEPDDDLQLDQARQD